MRALIHILQVLSTSEKNCSRFSGFLSHLGAPDSIQKGKCLVDIGVVGGHLVGGRGRGGGFVMLEGVLKNVGRSVVVGGGTGVKRGVEGMVDGVTEDLEEGEEDLNISCSTDSLSMSDESGSTLILIGLGLAGKVICGTVDGRGV